MEDAGAVDTLQEGRGRLGVLGHDGVRVRAAVAMDVRHSGLQVLGSKEAKGREEVRGGRHDDPT